MELTCQEALPPGWCADLEGVRQIAEQDPHGKVTLELSGLGRAAAVTERARAVGSRVLEFSVHGPNLSDSFMALTGRPLQGATPESEAV